MTRGEKDLKPQGPLPGEPKSPTVERPGPPPADPPAPMPMPGPLPGDPRT